MQNHDLIHANPCVTTLGSITKAFFYFSKFFIYWLYSLGSLALYYAFEIMYAFMKMPELNETKQKHPHSLYITDLYNNRRILIVPVYDKCFSEFFVIQFKGENVRLKSTIYRSLESSFWIACSHAHSLFSNSPQQKTIFSFMFYMLLQFLVLKQYCNSLSCSEYLESNRMVAINSSFPILCKWHSCYPLYMELYSTSKVHLRFPDEENFAVLHNMFGTLQSYIIDYPLLPTSPI